MNPAQQHTQTSQKPSHSNNLVDKAIKAFKPIRKTKSKTNPKEFNVAQLFRKKRGYIKLTEEKLAVLEDLFLKNKYPQKEDFNQIAAQTQEKAAKIENWFKQRRRKAVLDGKMTFEKKKVFSEQEQKLLMNEFLTNQSPPESHIRVIAGRLQCKPKSVRNWFNYKRKIASKIQNDPKKSDLIDFLMKQNENPEEKNNASIEFKCPSKPFNMNPATDSSKEAPESTNASHNSPKNDNFDSSEFPDFQNKDNLTNNVQFPANLGNLPPFLQREWNPMFPTPPTPMLPQFMQQMMYIDAFSNYMRTMTLNAVMSNMMMKNAMSFGMKKEA